MSIISTKFEEKLLNLLNEMENETGELYEISIMKFDSNEKKQIIGEIKKRQLTIEVYDMIDDYSELNGVYANYDDIEDKIAKMGYNEKYEELKEIEYEGQKELIGKCRNCHKYNDESKNYNRKCPNFVRLFTCQTRGCNDDRESKWRMIRVSSSYTSIYKSGGGRFAELTPIGKYKFINTTTPKN